jgi:hypothetical protein
MLCWLPGCFGDQVPFPEEKVLKLVMEEMSREFGRRHFLLQSRVRFMVEEKGADWGIKINGEIQGGRHEIHYEYETRMVTLNG